MFEITTIDADFLGEKCYHAGLLYRPLERILVIPSMWLGSHDNANTGKTYAKVLRQFGNYLAKIIHKEETLLEFWSYVGENQIKAWKSHRINSRKMTNSLSPTDKTIDDHGHVVAQFLLWVKEDRKKKCIFEGRSIVTVKNIKSEHLLKGMIGPVEREEMRTNLSVNHKPAPGTPVEVLAKRHQSKAHEYLFGDQIKRFIHAFPDKVWTFVCLTTYLTGLRNHEVLAVPRFVRYKHGYFTSIPEDIAKRIANGETTQILKVLGKGKKDRDVVFPLKAWLEIMTAYEPFYQERVKKFRDATGEIPELHLLWFNKLGEARYCLPGDQLNYETYRGPLTSAVYRLATRGGLAEEFGHCLDFYCLRHTFVTNYLLNVRKAREADPNEPTPTEANFLTDIRLIKALTDQIGHDDFKTTYASYVHNVFEIDSERLIPFPDIDDLLKQKR